MSIVQAAEQEQLLTIPLYLPRGVWKGRTMQESDSHNADSLRSLTAGSAEPTSGLQGSFSHKQVSLLVNNVTSNIWTFPDISWKGKEKQASHFKIRRGVFPSCFTWPTSPWIWKSQQIRALWIWEEKGLGDRERKGWLKTHRQGGREKQGRETEAVSANPFILHVCDTWQDNFSASGYL